MPIPDYQTLMLPLLKLTSDKQEHRVSDLVDKLSLQFKLTELEKKELLPSGQTFIFGSRVGWARTYLKKAGLLDSQKRAMVIITQRGIDVINKNLSHIDVKFLRQFPEFLDFHSAKKDDSDSVNITIETTVKQTPEEILQSGYQSIRTALAQDLRSRIIEMSPAFFEKLVVKLIVKMGYGGSIGDAGKAIGKTGDEGIDGTIKEDRLGLDIIYIQAKRWKIGNVVGRPEIHRFIGALAGQGAKKGIFITTSNFTKEAIEYTPRNETKIVLIDGEQLAELMIDYNLGVATQDVYEVKRIDSDFFEEE